MEAESGIMEMWERADRRGNVCDKDNPTIHSRLSIALSNRDSQHKMTFQALDGDGDSIALMTHLRRCFARYAREITRTRIQKSRVNRRLAARIFGTQDHENIYRVVTLFIQANAEHWPIQRDDLSKDGIRKSLRATPLSKGKRPCVIHVQSTEISSLKIVRLPSSDISRGMFSSAFQRESGTRPTSSSSHSLTDRMLHSKSSSERKKSAGPTRVAWLPCREQFRIIIAAKKTAKTEQQLSPTVVAFS
jgi:hypothetical protein